MIRVFGPCRDILPGTTPIATIGMFDGVHLGHQDVIGATAAWAREEGKPSLAITFDIHPRRIVSPHAAPPAITSLEHRLVLFERLGLDAALVLSFSPTLRAMPASEFVDDILCDCLQISGLVLGPDARVGADRDGDAAALARLGRERGFAVRTRPPRFYREQVISSTAIREAVQQGDLDTARAMLARPVSVLGTVVEGMGLARQLGFPTLNLDPHHELRPPAGVYVSRTRCGDTTWDSITNVGHRPTVAARDAADVLVESHLFGFSGNLYGQTVEVAFLQNIRSEIRFNSHAELAAQVKQDMQAARDVHRQAQTD